MSKPRHGHVFDRGGAHGHDLDRVAASLRGFGPAGLLVVLAVLLTGPYIGAALVLLWAWRSRTPWRDLGFVRPRSWALTIILGALGGVVLKLLMKIIVMPLLGAPDTNPAYQHLVGNAAALPGMLFMVIVSAGFGEEIIWRGFFFERAGRRFGTGTRAVVATVIVTAAVFGLAHYPGQHWMGVQQALIMGLLVGAFYAKTRNLWPLIVTHATFDIVGVMVIYLGLETRLANLVIR